MRRPDRSEFTQIMNRLAAIPLDQIATAIGASRTAASKIRSGGLVPHMRHWPALAELAGVPDPLSHPASAIDPQEVAAQ
jgi:hypothetical protein